MWDGGTRRSFSRAPYFSADEIRAGIAYANEARRLAAVNADYYREEIAKRRAAAEKSKESEKRSTEQFDRTSAAEIE